MRNRKWQMGNVCHSERLRPIFSARRTYAKETGSATSGGSVGSHLWHALRPEVRSFDGTDAAPFRTRSGFSQRRRYFEMV